MSFFISETDKIKLMNFFQNKIGSNFFKNIIYRVLIVPNQEIAIHRLNKIIKNSSIKNINKTGKKIIFNSVDAKYTRITYTSISFAKALQMRGHDVKMLLCDEVLKSCAGHFTIDKPPNKWECKNCKYFSKKIYETINLPYATYNEYLKKEDISKINSIVKNLSIEECKNFFYKKVRVGFHARTSADRYLKGGLPSEELYDNILRMELKNAIISAELAEKVFIKEKPDIIASSHTCYSSWGSFVEYFKNKKIKAFSWGESENHFTFDEEAIDENFKKYFKNYRKEKFLDESEEKELQNFLNKRFKGEVGQVSLYGFSEKKDEEINRIFRFDEFEKSYAIFPNVPWDASLLNADKGFKGVYEWIKYTIELFLDKPDLQLIIKIHPSEIKVMGSKKTVLDFINNNFKELSKNIFVIPPNTEISAYSLFNYIDVGLVYNGTLGLEMTINGIPVIVAGITHYGGKGFSYDISSREEYKNLIFEKNLKLTEKQIKFGKVYAYYYFLKRAIPQQILYYNSFLNLGWNIKSLDELKPGKNKYIDLICNYIINGGVYQDWDIKK